MRIKVILQIALLGVLLLAGCSPVGDDIASFVKPGEVTVTAENYVLQPPDEIEIQCSKAPEVHLQRQRIRPDGKVTFEALGEIYAAGKTPDELAKMLEEKIIQLYTLTGDNPIDVRIVAYQSKVYYVLGEVYYPGAKICTGRDDLFSALSQARPSILAWTERTRIIRPSTDENVKAKSFEVDYKAMMREGDLSRNIYIEEGDIVYVPPTILAAISMKVEEIVRPIGRAFSTVNIVQGPPTSQ